MGIPHGHLRPRHRFDVLVDNGVAGTACQGLVRGRTEFANTSSRVVMIDPRGLLSRRRNVLLINAGRAGELALLPTIKPVDEAAGVCSLRSHFVSRGSCRCICCGGEIDPSP